LAKLINPKNLYVNLECDEVSGELLGQCKTLFGLIHNGKVGLKLPGWNGAPVLNRLASHLNTLECYFEVLKDANVVSTFNLDYYMTYSTLNKEKFEALLHYNIRKIFVYRIQIDDGHAITELDSGKLQVNSLLQTLEIDWFSGSYESLLEIFDLLKHYCPHLRSLQISFDFLDAVLCPQNKVVEMEEILKKLPEIHEKLKGIGVSMPLSELVIHATSSFRTPKNSTDDSNWPKKLKDHEGFKNVVDSKYDFMNVEFKSEYGFFTLMHRIKITREVGRDDDVYNDAYDDSNDYYDNDYLSADNYDPDDDFYYNSYSGRRGYFSRDY